VVVNLRLEVGRRDGEDWRTALVRPDSRFEEGRQTTTKLK
jgi:hypothetical protein